MDKYTASPLPDIIPVIEKYSVSLKKKGREYIGLCPFHPERTPSFHVNPDKNVFNCFGCGKSGNTIQFVAFMENISVLEAVKSLDIKSAFDHTEWLNRRGISGATADHFGIYMKGDNAIAFPYYSNGLVVNNKYRDLNKKNFWCDKGSEKPWYNGDAIIDSDTVIICEGEMDVLTIYQAGFKAVISPFNGINARFDPEPLKNKKITFAGDMDEAGQLLAAKFPDASRVQWPDGCKDANDTLVKFGTDKVRECLENPVIVEKNDPLSKFKRSLLDQTHEYPLPEPVVNLVQNSETHPLLTLKSFSLWQGKAKSKKTTVLALIVAAIIRVVACLDPIRFERGTPGKILFFDCEQGQAYAARTMKLSLKMADVQNSPNLYYSDLREFTPVERLEIIEAAIQDNPDIRLVIIDGLVDLMTDFMDAQEGQSMITKIGAWCSKYNIHIAGVLHQNKADKNARAHVGSIAGQKGEIEIMTEVDSKNPAQSIVSAVLSRGMPFEPFAIEWKKGALPCIVQEWSQQADSDEKSAKHFSDVQKIVDKVFAPPNSYRPKEAISAIMQMTHKKVGTAKSRFSEMKEWGMITETSGIWRKAI